MHSTLAKALIAAATTAILATGTAKAAPENAGPNKATTQLPFQSQTVARFDLPWAIAVIDADRLIVTTKPGRMFLVDHKGGEPIEVSGLPKVAHSGQNGLLDAALAPDFAESRPHLLHLCRTRRWWQFAGACPCDGWPSSKARRGSTASR